MKKKLPEDAESVLVMRGRGNDELAPSRELLEDFNAAKEEFSRRETPLDTYKHAWLASDYENRFRRQILSNPASMAKLKQLSKRCETRDIFLICYEAEDKPCHRKLLLDIAEESFSATVNREPFGQQPSLFPVDENKKSNSPKTQ